VTLIACGGSSTGHDAGSGGSGGGSGGASGSGGSGGSGGSPGVVSCFGTMCELVAGGCCTVSGHTCMSNCQGPYDHFFCDGPEDCGGMHCCGYVGAEVNGSYCASNCSPWNTLCHTAADCPTAQSTCSTAATSYPSGVCQ